MRTVAAYEKRAYLSRHASGCSYENEDSIEQLADHLGVPAKDVWKMIRAGTIVRRRIQDGAGWRVLILSEDVIAAIKKLDAAKRRQGFKLVKGSRRADAGSVKE
jgi:6-phosphogluconate dehydrogenase (decarboxylating)